MFTISTGEPPTPPVNISQSSANPSATNTTSEPKATSRRLEDSGRVPSDFEDSGKVPSDFEDSGRVPSAIEDGGRMRSDLEDSGRIPSDFEDSGRMPQEPDSGYEASPCSIADTCQDSLHFFGEEERPADDVFEDFVLLEPEEEEDEDCLGSPCRCTSRPESSSAAETVLDGDLSSSNCDSDSSHPPSSLPIRIPVLNPRALTNSPAYCTRTVFPFHPRSCPATWLGQASGSSPLARMTTEMERLRRRASLQNQRRRRMQIDSDASSDVDSSDDNFLSDDGLENEVFPMAAEEEEEPRRLVPLPDIVLHSSSSSSSSSVRRSRSASINLPPEPEVLQNIGRSLRRLSDEFQIRREAGHARRRQTISSIDSYYRAS